MDTFGVIDAGFASGTKKARQTAAGPFVAEVSPLSMMHKES
jgi:hypothetical protein